MHKSEVVAVALDSYPLWLRKRPVNAATTTASAAVAAAPPPSSFRTARAPPPHPMRSLWKMSLFYSVFDSSRSFITMHELCARTWKFKFKQEEYYAGPEPWCMFNKDFTYTSSLFVREGGGMHSMSWQFLDVVEACAGCYVQVCRVRRVMTWDV
jgi:hypothetical protein